MDGEADGKPVPQALLDRGVVPFLKIDKGLEEESDGVKLMKPNPGLDALLERADRKSTRLNSSHANISYAVFCLKKKKNETAEKYSEDNVEKARQQPEPRKHLRQSIS